MFGLVCGGFAACRQLAVRLRAKHSVTFVGVCACVSVIRFDFCFHCMLSVAGGFSGIVGWRVVLQS